MIEVAVVWSTWPNTRCKKSNDFIPVGPYPGWLINFRNVRDLKNHYKNNLIQVNGESQSILNELAALIRFKIKSTSARTNKMLLFGPPGSGRSTIINEIHRKLGLVPISISKLLMEQVERKTQVGREVADSLKSGELVSDEIVFGLLKSRLEKADCRLNGYVLEGFPKTMNQIRMMETLELKLKPFFYVNLQCDDIVKKSKIIFSSFASKDSKTVIWTRRL